jgi:hypothetical protein
MGEGGEEGMKPPAFLLLGVLTIALQPNAQPVVEGKSCTPSPLIRASAPPDPNADPVGPVDWYINADRTIWAGPVPAGGWPSGGELHTGTKVVKGQKTYWVRPAGTPLLISGRRLDGSAPPVEAHIPCCYPTGFQIVGLFFPREGCWEVHAKAGKSELRFVTQVRPPAVTQTR